MNQAIWTRSLTRQLERESGVWLALRVMIRNGLRMLDVMMHMAASGEQSYMKGGLEVMSSSG